MRGYLDGDGVMLQEAGKGEYFLGTEKCITHPHILDIE